MPAMRKRRRVAEEAFQTQRMDRLMERWHDEWRGQFRQKARDFLNIDLPNLDDEELLAHLDRTVEFLRWGQAVHFRLMMPYLLRNYELSKVCEELLGWDTPQAMLLLSGTSETSSEPGRRLAEMAALADGSPKAKKVILDGNDVILRLREVEPSIAEAFDAYLNEYGHRTTNYEPGSPTLAEKPELLVNLLRDRMAGSKPSEAHDPGEIREDAVKRARSELAERSPAERERFEKTLEAAWRANPVREDNVFYTDNVPNALIRYTALEIGRRLVARGIIPNRTDVVYLEDTELRSVLSGGQQDFAVLVACRKLERAWVVAHPGPASYGKDPGPPPDPGIMPEPWRTMTRAQLWWMNVGFTSPNGVSTDYGIAGVPGSPGRYKGTVRIIRDESEFSRLMPGDVLGCPITTPTWSVLFTQAGAVVTDGGGVLSHAAIIARENGIPAVLGTVNATQRLVDGQTVTVDGNKGTVEIVPID
jgi:pyruvate,water dikinase